MESQMDKTHRAVSQLVCQSVNQSIIQSISQGYDIRRSYCPVKDYIIVCDDGVDNNDNHHHHHHRHEIIRISSYFEENLFQESHHFLWLSVAIFVALRLLSDPKEIPFVLRLSVSILSTRLLSIALVCLDTFNLFMTVVWCQESLLV